MTAGFSTSPRTAVFQGIIDVPIATWLDTYVPVNTGWSFGTSMWPVDYGWRKDPVTDAAVALKGTVFGEAIKQTSFAYGDFTAGIGGISAPRGNCIYNNGRLRGFYKNDSLPVATANTFDYGITLGSNVVQPTFSGVNYPSITGARIPGNSFTDGSQLGASGIIYSMNDVNTLVDDYLLSWANGGGVVNGNPLGFKFPLRGLFPTDLALLCPDNFGNNWATVGGSGSNGRLLCLCDFSVPGNLAFFTLTWDNATLDTYLQSDFGSANVTRATPFGWLSCTINNSTASRPVTINGTLYTSYMILTSFDATKYWLLNIRGLDGNGQNWQSNIGTVQACIFPSGTMLIHSTHQDAIINASVQTSSIFKQLPVFPPVALPSPPADTEIPLTSFREINANS